MGTLYELGTQIRAARQAAGWSQSVLCGHAGISRDTLSRLERGEPVDTSTLTKVVSALGLMVALAKQQPRAADMRKKFAHLHEDSE